MKNELEHNIDGDLKIHQSMFEIWRKEFNEERPHEALDMKKPAQIYTKSIRKYKKIDYFVYPSDYISRQVNDRGYTIYKGRRIFLSNAFNGFNVGLDIKQKDRVKVWFANNFLGEIDKKSYIFTPNEKLITVN